MALQIASNLTPAGTGAYYLLEDVYLKGGFSVQDSVSARDAIALSNLKMGQLVLTVAEQKIWQVTDLVLQSRDNPDVTESVTWTEFLTGGVSDDAPQDGKTYGRQDGAWVQVQAGSGGPTGLTPTSRTVAIQTISGLTQGVDQTFTLQLAVSCIVLKLSVSRPCKISAYGTPSMDEPNPYQFQGTDDHLTDDGSMLLSDGTVFRTRNFSIFANMEDTPTENMYFVASATDDGEGDVVLTVTYLPLEVLPDTGDSSDAGTDDGSGTSTPTP